MKRLSSDDLAVVGEALYGLRWKAALSADLGIPYRTLMRWLADGADLEVEHLIALRGVLRRRLEGIEDARKLLWSRLEVR